MEWISVDDRTPKINQNVIAIGTWWGEINGMGESDYMGIGEWHGNHVSIDSDTYCTSILHVTHWMALPEAPE